MIKRLAWIVIIAAAAAGGCLTGSGAIRGETLARAAADASSPTAVAPLSPAPASR
jgi:hypothetical protein